MQLVKNLLLHAWLALYLYWVGLLEVAVSLFLWFLRQQLLLTCSLLLWLSHFCLLVPRGELFKEFCPFIHSGYTLMIHFIHLHDFDFDYHQLLRIHQLCSSDSLLSPSQILHLSSLTDTFHSSLAIFCALVPTIPTPQPPSPTPHPGPLHMLFPLSAT